MQQSFSKLISVSTALIFVLSFANFNIQASEKGLEGISLIPEVKMQTIEILYAKGVPEILGSKVAGYEVFEVSAAVSSFGINTNTNDDSVTPIPIVVETPTSTPTIDLTITNIQVRPRTNEYDPTDKFEVVVTVKNNGDTSLSQYDLLRSTLTITAGTNTAAIEACGVGTCRNVGNSYNAGLYLSAPAVQVIAAQGTQEYVLNQQTYIGTKPYFNNGLSYKIKAVVDDNSYFTESDETNNISTIAYSTGVAAQCAQAGLRADIYGGPNQVCCTGLILQGGLCNVPSTTPTSTIALLPDLAVVSGEAVSAGLKFEFCNKGAASNSFPVAITVNEIARNFDLSGVRIAKSCQTHTWDYGVWGLIGEAGKVYNVKAWADPQQLITEVTESNNSLTKMMSFSSNASCKGPYHVLAPDGRCVWSCSEGTTPGKVAPFECVCKPGFKETSTDRFGRRVCTLSPIYDDQKFTICHHTGTAKKYEEITVDSNGWKNGHAKHSEDYVKTSDKSCGDLAKPLPLPDKPRPIAGADEKDKIIAELKARIERLQLRISELEKKVVEREKNRETTVDQNLVNRLQGKLLIQPHENGEVWYLDPQTDKKFYLKDGEGAYQGMRAFGTGISEKDFGNLKNLCTNVKGKILLRVERNGEAYYVNEKCESFYLKNGEAAYEIMKEQALGINNAEIAKIETGDLSNITEE